MREANLFKKIVFIAIMLVSQLLFARTVSAVQEMDLYDEGAALISMDLKDASIKDVLKVLSMQSGKNFIASEAVADRKLTLYFDKVPLQDVMDKLFKANNLSYELTQDNNIIIVKDWGKPSIETETRVFYLKHATVSSSSLKEEMSNNLSGEAEVISATGESSSSSSSSSSGQNGKWKSESEAGITSVIKKILSKDGTIIEDFRTNSLIVTDIPTKMEVIAKVIASLDVPVAQVMLEVEMLDVSKNVVDQMGFKYGQTPLEISVKGAKASLGAPYGSWAKVFQNQVLPADAEGSYGEISINPNGYTIQLDWLRTQTDTKFLARPRILTLNNETAEIKITTNEAIGVKVSTQTVGSTGNQTAEAERFETGVFLRVTPQIDQDTGEITMFIYPSVSEASSNKVTFSAGDSGSYSFVNPETRSTKATVRVKDGETVVLGGLIRHQTTNVETKLPVLGDLPLVGGLFRHKDTDPGMERELLVFITPRIMKNPNTDVPRTDKKLVLPQREQALISNATRQQSIGNYLSNFERQR
jgi:type IV pilus assembly protein PilQ